MIRPAEEALELPGLYAILRRYLSGPLGRRALDRQAESPRFETPDEASHALAEIGEAMEWLRAAEASDRRTLTPLPRFQAVHDMTEAAQKLSAAGSVLEAQEIHGLLELLERVDETRQRLWRERARRPLLGARGDELGEFRDLLRELSGKILPNGELADHASSGLARARRQIEQQRQRIRVTLDRFVRKHFDDGVLQEDYATIRNGRSVVPVKASWKGQVNGVVHTASASGQTVFVEPLETIAENNKLVELLEEEQREILRILREMTERLREDAASIQTSVRAHGEIEALFAKARFGREFRCCLPRFSDDALKLEWARHPLLQDVLGREGKKVVPMGIELVEGSRVLVISGPNAGGKTIALKTVGLFALMAQSGLPVPAAEAVFPWFGRILVDIGDAQSIEASLSTFSAHIETLKTMMSRSTGQSLVIIDELAGATDPQEGGALAVAVVDHFLEKGAFALVSTHLPALKVHSATTPGLVAAAMGFDQKTLSPTHKLLVGVPGDSAGLSMAERFGVPAEVIARAREALAEQEERAAAYLQTLRSQVEDYETKLESLRVEEHRLHERERELEREMEQREKAKLAEIERRFDKSLREAQAANEKALGEALDRIQGKAASRRGQALAEREAAKTQREARERLRSAAAVALGKEAPAAAGPAPDAIQEGAEVKLGSFGATGRVVRALGGDRWEVQVGQLKMQVGRDDIVEVKAPAAAQKGGGLPDGVTFRAPREEKTLEQLSEINVIGRTVDEAQSAVDKFLDEAVLADVRRLRVIHGHGTNALRRGLWQLFAGHVHVDKYYQAEQFEGGAGATIVEVKV